MPEPASDISLDSAALDSLNNPQAKTLLNTIDSLRALEVGEIVHLPQIIVVGDQSSGKSSVLEAISHVRFPVKGDVCTRFATELVLRKAGKSNVDVSIRFSSSGGRANASSEPFRKTGFSRDDLPRLVEEATEKMGVRAGTTNDFSKDVLHVKITGPDVPSLTLVDLPGFFHSATGDQSLQGKNTVDELVRGYMKQNNSIILAVVAANAQLAGQVVLDRCLEHDAGRTRTMGVITKPDLAPAGSDNERKYLQLAQNKEPRHKLALGWHVLRNSTENERCSVEDASNERDERETRFLGSGPWAELAPGQKGIASLRRKLGEVLLNHIQETLPGVIDDIESSLEGRITKLSQLGKARTTIQDMKTYLIDIAEEIQRLVRDGVNGIYSDGFFGDLEDTDRKLRANLRNLNHAFDITLLTKGASRRILPDNVESDKDESDEDDPGKEIRNSLRDLESDVPDYLHPFVSCYDFDDPEEISESDLCKELEAYAAANQGKEFPGVPNKDLVVQLFQEQAQPWRAISQRHIDLATDVVREFMENLITHVVGEGNATTLAILRNCIDPFFDERSKVLASKLEELLGPYEKGYGLPLGGEYHSSLSRITLTRLASRVSNILLDEFSEASQLNAKKISNAIANADELRRHHFGTETIVDMMEAYYEMSRRTFAENIANLAVESCLVCHVDGILTPSKVNVMEDEEVRELASESPDVTYERELLASQVAKLKDGLKICHRNRPRGAQALSSTLSAGRAASRRSPSVTPSSTPARAMPAAEGNMKLASADATPGNAASSSTTQNGSLFSNPQAPSSTTQNSSLFSNPQGSSSTTQNSSLFSNPQASSTSGKFDTPSFGYNWKDNRLGATPGNAGSSSTTKTESIFSKPLSSGDTPRFGSPSVLDSSSESCQTRSPPTFGLFGSGRLVKQAPRSDLGSKGPSTGGGRTGIAAVEWYPLKPADFTARATGGLALYEAARDQHFVRSRGCPPFSSIVEVFGHICCAEELSLRQKSAEEWRWEYYQGNYL